MPHDLCDDLINFHTQSPNKCEGKAGDRINKNIKASTDTSIPFDHILFHDSYIQQLHYTTFAS